MKRTVILGAGQIGRTTAQLINMNNYHLMALGDNDAQKWNQTVRTGSGEVPVMSVRAAIGLEPEVVLICLLGNDRIAQLAEQVRTFGYSGEIRAVKDSVELFDIRTRCMILLSDRIKESKVHGSVAELGVYRGDTARVINLCFPDRRLFLFDTFNGFDPRDLNKEMANSFSFSRAGAFADTSAETVLSRLSHPENAIIRKGYFPETAKGLENEDYALVSLDPDLYAPTLAGLEYFYPRLQPGGAMVVHDYNNQQFNGVRKAVCDYEEKYGRLNFVPLGDLHGSCVILK